MRTFLQLFKCNYYKVFRKRAFIITGVEKKCDKKRGAHIQQINIQAQQKYFVIVFRKCFIKLCSTMNPPKKAKHVIKYFSNKLYLPSKKIFLQLHLQLQKFNFVHAFTKTREEKFFINAIIFAQKIFSHTLENLQQLHHLLALTINQL